MQPTNRRLLVTGGAGFIGSHLVEEAVARGWEVGVLDNLRTGHRKHVLPGLAFFKTDIRDRAGVEQPSNPTPQHVQGKRDGWVRGPDGRLLRWYARLSF